jgi:exportin-1
MMVAIYGLNADLLKTVIDSIVWAMKHTDPHAAEVGLEAMLALLSNLSQDKAGLSKFYSSHFLQLCKETLAVLTDSLHKAGFKQQVQVLRELMQAVAKNELVDPIAPAGTSNQDYVKAFVAASLIFSFPHVSKATVGGFVDEMLAKSHHWEDFKVAVRDFLIATKEFDHDNEALYAEERLVSHVTPS